MYIVKNVYIYVFVDRLLARHGAEGGRHHYCYGRRLRCRRSNKHFCFIALTPNISALASSSVFFSRLEMSDTHVRCNGAKGVSHHHCHGRRLRCRRSNELYYSSCVGCGLGLRGVRVVGCGLRRRLVASMWFMGVWALGAGIQCMGRDGADGGRYQPCHGVGACTVAGQMVSSLLLSRPEMSDGAKGGSHDPCHGRACAAAGQIAGKGSKGGPHMMGPVCSTDGP